MNTNAGNSHVERTARNLAEQLSPAETSQLIRLLLEAHCRSVSPVDAAENFRQARRALQRALESQRPTVEELDQVAEDLFYTFDGFLNIATIGATLNANRPERRAWWQRIHSDALQLRDDFSNAVSPDHDWGDDSDDLPPKEAGAR